VRERNATTARRLSDLVLIITFVVVVGLPCVGTFFSIDTAALRSENREPEPFPELHASKASVEQYPRALEAWFNDHFGFRNSFIKWHSTVKVEWFDTSTSDRVVLGKDGWLFYSARRIMDDYQGRHPFTDADLRRWQRLLEERRDWLASKDIRYVFVVAPEKSSIYPEHLPDEIGKNRGTMRLDQLVAYVRAHSDVEVIDLRETFLAEKSDGELLFRKTDTHWSDLGAFLAYRTVVEKLAVMFPAITPMKRAALTRTETTTCGEDLASMLGIKRRYTEQVVRYAPTPGLMAKKAEWSDLMKQKTWRPGLAPEVYVTDDVSLPRAVVIHDSFGVQAKPFLSTNFSRTVYLWQQFHPDVIADEKPDLVIHEVVQRVLSSFTSINPSRNPAPLDGFRRE